MIYSVVLEPTSIKDVQVVIDYYDEKSLGMGSKFEEVLNASLINLTINPQFQKRYKSVHCLPLKKFPQMSGKTDNE